MKVLGLGYLRALAAGMLLSSLEVNVAAGASPELVNRPSALFGGSMLGVLSYALASFVVVLVMRPVLTRSTKFDPDLADKTGTLVTLTIGTVLISKGLVGFNLLSLTPFAGILQSVGLGGVAGFLLMIVNEDVRAQFSMFFDRVLFAAATAFTVLVPWIAFRQAEYASSGMASLDGLIIIGLSLLVVFTVSRLRAQALGRIMLLFGLAAVLAGVVAPSKHDPFLHFATRESGIVQHKMSLKESLFLTQSEPEARADPALEGGMLRADANHDAAGAEFDPGGDAGILGRQ